VKRARAIAFAALLLCALDGIAAPIDLSARVEVLAANPRTTLDRTTGRTISTVDVTLTNKGDRAIETPLHALVFFTAQSGLLDGLQVTGASGGLNAAPYQTFYYDLTNLLATGTLAPGGAVSFVLRFSPARGAQVSYRIVPFGVLNRDPVADAGGPYAARVGEPISFSSAASSDPDGDPVSVSWNFGDGTPTSTEPSPTHAFGATGVFDVTLTVRDSRGGSNTTRVPALISPAEEFGLARVRSLDGAGLPLGGVQVAEKLNGQTTTFTTDASTGYSSLGRGPGNYTWKFSKQGHLDVWRSATIAPNTVAILPNPWLAQQSTVSTAISPITDAQLSAAGATVSFDAGSFEQPTAATLTAVPTQALPFPLPAGWSPLSQFHLQTSTEPTQPGTATLTLAGALASGEEAAFVKLDAASLEWRVVALASGGTSVNVPVPSSGSFAVVVRDSAPRAPPAPVIGEPIQPTTAVSDVFGISASGSVTPAVSSPSRDAAQVTATARIVFSNPTALSSGLFFRTLVRESYALFNGSTTRAPEYDTTVFAYHRPGDALAASFPMRPQLLLGPDELMEATVRAEVLEPCAFGGGVVGSAGGQLGDGDTRVIVPAGALPALQAAEIGTLDAQSFTGLSGGIVPARAFALNIGGLAPGHAFAFEFGILEPNAFYVLGRAVSASGASGITPVERFVTDAEGRLASAEPQGGDRLPGARGSGEYVLLKVNGPLALVRGTVADTSGALTGGLIVRVAGQPWVLISGGDGSYRTLMPVGTSQLIVLDPRDGNQGVASITITDPAQPQEANVTTAPTGPRVVSSDPAAGATGVRTVAPIIVRFSERILAASFGADGVVLRAADGSVVPGSLSLNGTGTVATLLPTNPLAPETGYTIEVSAAITDATDLPLEGNRVFTFTTAPLTARGQGAQLTIYEPGATKIPQNVIDMIPAFTPQAGSSIVVAHGNQGTADPEVPVILVNLNSGETSTVLSKPDGSFAGFVDGSEEEFISAVFVNANGTRIEVPAIRQHFDDGRVGLYRQGGILEAESDGGPVQVIVEPNAIPNRTKFSVSVIPLAELLARLQDALPSEGKLLSGVKVEAEGDPLTQPLDVSIPVRPEDLGLPPGVTPEQASYAVGRVIEEDGVKVYDILEDARYEEGKIVTNSPPMFGLFPEASPDGSARLIPVEALFFAVPSAGAIFTGRVVRVPENFSGSIATSVDVAELEGVRGALVSAGAATNSPGLRPGSFVSRTNKHGFYSVKLPVQGNGPSGIRAVSDRFPGLLALGQAARMVASKDIRIVNLAFRVPNASANDNIPPVVTLSTPSSALPPNADVLLRFNALDDTSTPQFQEIDWVRGGASDPGHQGSYGLDGTPLAENEVTLTLQAPQPAGQASTQLATVRVARDARLVFRVKVTDAAGNLSERLLSVLFSGTLPTPPDAELAADPTDALPPRVVAVTPNDGQTVGEVSAISVSFNEAISREIENGLGVSVLGSVSGPLPVGITVAADQLSARISVAGLRPGETVTLTLQSPIRDLKGNPLETFTSSFRLASAPTSTVAAEGVVATLVRGAFGIVVERGTNGGRVRTYRLSGPNPQLVGEAALPAFPRVAALVPRYDFKLRPGTETLSRPLLVVAGGTVGEDNIGQWVQVFDLSDMANPTRVAGKLALQDFASTISVLKVSEGAIYAAANTPEGPLLYRIDLQGLVLGSNYTDAEYAANPTPFFGADHNNDGDYVDPGEQLPIPVKIGLPGLDLSIELEPDRTLNDFAVLEPGGLLLGLVYSGKAGVAGRFDLTRVDGEILRSFDFPAGLNPLRVLLEPSIDVMTPSGRKNLNPGAIVTVGSEAWIFDLGGPLNPGQILVPPVVQKIVLPPGAGNILAVARDEMRGWILATGSRTFHLGRAKLATDLPAGSGPHPALQAGFDIGSAGRNIGVSPGYFSGTSGGAAAFVVRPPRINIVTLSTRPVLNASSLSPSVAEAVTREAIPQDYILPATLKAQGEGFPAATANPPPPNQHYYVLVEAPGDLGAEMTLAVESLRRDGRRQAPKGTAFGPVMLTDLPSTAEIEGAQPSVTAQRAFRLSSDPSSPEFNYYLSQPLLVIREALSPEIITQITSVAGRQPVQIGEQMRVSLEKIENLTLLPDADSPQPTNGEQPPEGISHTVASCCAEFVDSANPSPPGSAHRFGGVSLQSGEFQHLATDYSIEGRATSLSLVRSYESQSHYNGPFGRGWDFNWNRRLCELPSGRVPDGTRLPITVYGTPALDLVARPGDVILLDGSGDAQLFKRIGPLHANVGQQSLYSSDPAITEFGWTGRVTGFFESPRGRYEVLYKFSDGSFVMVDASATRVYYDAEGRLQKVVAPYLASTTTLRYRADGKLDKVEGDRGVALEFGYYGRTTSTNFRPLDQPYNHVANIGLIARVKAGPENRTYRYNERNDLERVIGTGPNDLVYGYDPQPPHQMTSAGRGDGAGQPSQKLSYSNGLVKTVTVDGDTREVIGAKATAQERLAAGNQTLQLKKGDQVAEFAVDNLGNARSFAGRAITPSSDGSPARMENSATGSGVNFVRDEANPVYRFRGNMLQLVGDGGTATSEYDGSAWNRLKKTTAPNGVETIYDFAVTEQGTHPGRELTITVGGVNKRVLRFDPWGALEREETSEAGVAFQRQVILDFAEGLPKGFKLGDLPSIEFGRSGSAVSSLKVGGVSLLAPSFDNDGLLSGLGGGPKVPGLVLSYDGSGRLETADLGDGKLKHKSVYASPTSSRIQSTTVEEEGVPTADVSFAHDALGRLETLSQNGRTTSLTYSGATVTGHSGPGVQRSLQPGANGGTSTLTEQGVAQQITVTPQGRVASITSQGARRTFTYGTGGRIDGQAVVDVATGGTLIDEQYVYDSVGRHQKTTSGGTTWEREYFPDHGLRALKIDGFEVRRADRNSAGLITHVEMLGGTLEADYSNFDPVSNQPQTKRLSLQGGVTVTESRSFDELGRMATRSVGGLAPWRFDYDDFGHLSEIADPDGVVVRYDHSPSGLALGQTFGDGTSVSYAYTDDRVLTGIGNVQITPNEHRLPGTISYPDGTSEVHSDYNSFLHPQTVTIGGVAQNHTWTDGRITRIEVPSTNDLLVVGYDGLGRVRSSTANGYQIQYGFSPSFGQTSETTPLGTWSLTLNGSGLPTGETYPSGLAIDFAPTTNGQPMQVDAVGITAVTWAGVEEPQVINFAGGLKISRQYDAALRLKGVTYEAGEEDEQQVVAGFEWALTPGGRVRHEKRLHDGGRFDVYTRNGPTEAMRITGATFDADSAAGEGPTALRVEGIAYSAESEIDFSEATTNGFSTRAIFPQPGDELTNGPRGLPVSGPVWANIAPTAGRFPATFEYDGFGRLRRIQRRDPGTQAVRVTVTYKRDGRGRIVEREVVGPPGECRPGTFRYVWRGGRLLEEYQVVSDANQLVRRYVYLGNSLVALQTVIVPGGPLETVVPLVSFNGSIGGYIKPTGELLEVIRYGLFGLPEVQANIGPVARSGIGSTLLFQGAFYEEEAGLYDMRGRTLHPVFGRFLQRDSELYKESRALYLAFEGDPISNVDPSGARSRKAKGTRALTKWELGLAKAFETWSAWGAGEEEEEEGDPFIVSSFGIDAELEDGAFDDDDGNGPLDRFKNWAEGSQPSEQAEEEKDSFKDKVAEIKDVASDLFEKSGEFVGAWRKLSEANADISRFDLVLNKRIEHVIKTGVGITTDSRFGELSDTRRAELVSKAADARVEFAEKSVGLASFALSGVKAVYEKAFPEKEGRDATRLQLVAGSGIDATEQLLTVAEKAFELRKTQQTINAALAGGEAAQLEATVGGLKLSGSASSLAMRGLVTVQAAQAGFDAGYAGGKALITAYLGIVDPQIARDYRNAVKTFEDNGGFNLALLGGALATVGAPDPVVQKLQDLSDLEFDVKLKEELGLDELGAGPKDRLFYYYNGLKAP
jgi:RHS repeat-associated protein